MKYDKDSMGMAAADEFLMQRQKYNDQISENMKLFHQIESKKHKQEQMHQEEEKKKKDKLYELRTQIENLVSSERKKLDALRDEMNKM